MKAQYPILNTMRWNLTKQASYEEDLETGRYIDNHFNKLLDPNVCIQDKIRMSNVLLNLIDQWRTSLDKSEFVRTLFVDLSKCFDCRERYLITTVL